MPRSAEEAYAVEGSEDYRPALGGFASAKDDASVSTAGSADRTLKSSTNNTDGTSVVIRHEPILECCEHSVSFIDTNYRLALSRSKAGREFFDCDNKTALDSVQKEKVKPCAPNTAEAVTQNANGIDSSLNCKVYPIEMSHSGRSSNASGSLGVHSLSTHDKSAMYGTRLG